MSDGPWRPADAPRVPGGARLVSPAAERNGPPLQAALSERLGATGRALEIASGSGQHSARFAAAFAGWWWQPTDVSDEALASIAAWCDGLPNVAPPQRLDLLAPDGAAPPASPVDLVFCANLLHIAPWPVVPALMRLAAAALTPGGRLMVYGPFEVDGEALAPSNVAFDASLRSRDERWGLRQLGAVQAEATAAGLRWVERVPMPAHNQLLVFDRF
ncbi:class I SAM-dependent methyltransferase [Aquabacterium sp. J223]|uniref:class I SAM-dependent methyltransferase n=1 Tax=Aquabacterium sp. J223 TaxID=2898431 RepID=UPI0021AE1AC9|nr:class I SAM-dependent methyltransferase [Aquabacterium sp. J223]UUX93965.1 class I SAM-dependent methyltransferase [Aquabacterium sp. J223]